MMAVEKQLERPREDNPAHYNRYPLIGLTCTDCEPPRLVVVENVRRWKTMSRAESEEEGVILAHKHMAAWLTHMSRVHGIALPDEAFPMSADPRGKPPASTP